MLGFAFLELKKEKKKSKGLEKLSMFSLYLSTIEKSILRR